MKKLIALASLVVIMVACTVPYYYDCADFEDVPLPDAGYFDADLLGAFKSRDIIFTSEWVSEYGGYSNGGIYPSNLNDSITTGILNQYSSYPKPNGNFAVVHYNDYVSSTIENYATFILPEPTMVESVKVANSTYTYWAIKNGDDGFGSCRAYKDGDWFKVTFTGYNACGENLGSVDYYLADFRNGKSFIEKGWASVSLVSLGEEVLKVSISFSGTDIGDYGLNTPTYCVIDEIDYRIYD
jgi:hypothetical protein